MYSKLNQSYRKRHNLDFTTELGNTIASKIIIDVLKSVVLKISELQSLEMPEEDIELLLLHNDIYKYNYLTGNDFIEQLALQYKFDILALPTIEFDEIEDTFKTHFVKESANLFYNYIIESINELLTAETDDKYVHIHVTLFEMSRIEVMLPYLDKNHLIKLITYLDNLNTYKETETIKTIKKIVRKRKEAFE